LRTTHWGRNSKTNKFINKNLKKSFKVLWPLTLRWKFFYFLYNHYKFWNNWKWEKIFPHLISVLRIKLQVENEDDYHAGIIDLQYLGDKFTCNIYYIIWIIFCITIYRCKNLKHPRAREDTKITRIVQFLLKILNYKKFIIILKYIIITLTMTQHGSEHAIIIIILKLWRPCRWIKKLKFNGKILLQSRNNSMFFAKSNWNVINK
jgi:hypothetical protein